MPEYRLPRNILQAEIKRIEALGVIVHLNHRVEDVLAEKEAGNFDAVFLGIGANIGKKEPIAVDKSFLVIDAYQFLREVHNGNTPALGKKVLIYGGGKLAMYQSCWYRRV